MKMKSRVGRKKEVKGGGGWTPCGEKHLVEAFLWKNSVEADHKRYCYTAWQLWREEVKFENEVSLELSTLQLWWVREFRWSTSSELSPQVTPENPTRSFNRLGPLAAPFNKHVFVVSKTPSESLISRIPHHVTSSFENMKKKKKNRGIK